MKRRLLLVFTAMGAVLLLWALFGGSKHRFTLADGTTVTFHGVSVGASNRYCFGNPVRRVAAKLPWSWAQKFAASAVLTVPGVGRTNLVIWVTYRGTAPRGGRPFRFRCVHEGGTNELAFHAITKYGLPSGEAGAGFYTSLWPRRSKRLTLQALADDAPPDAKPLWEVRVTNPLRFDGPQRMPEGLPISRTVDDVTFSLEQLVFSENRLVTISNRNTSDAEEVQARLRVTRGGQPDNDWEIYCLSFSDTLGNRFQQLKRLGSHSFGGKHDFDFVLPLAAGERGGKLGVAFVRARGFATNELFTLPELALGKHVRETLRTNSPFGEVSLFVIAQDRDSDDGGIDVSIHKGEPLLSELSTPNARWFQPLVALDDRGRSYSFAAFQPYRAGSPPFHNFRVGSGAGRLKLTVAAARMVFVEYSVGLESITRPK